MVYCPKCGTEVNEEMVFCPKCGAALKAEQPRAHRAEKAEKQEKQEKQEKREKSEKYEKREFGFIGPLIGGLILVFLGFISYLQVIGYLGREIVGALFLVMIGVIIIVVGLYAMVLASRRHPRT
jgi:uncharacterized membrane protein YdbT with pleckstrin-like domain